MKQFRTHLPSSLPLAAGAVLFGLMLGVTSASASEQDAQAACTSDVMRFCQEFIPDHGRIAACLGKHHRALAPACRSVMAHSKKKQRHAAR